MLAKSQGNRCPALLSGEGPYVQMSHIYHLHSAFQNAQQVFSLRSLIIPILQMDNRNEKERQYDAFLHSFPQDRSLGVSCSTWAIFWHVATFYSNPQFGFLCPEPPLLSTETLCTSTGALTFVQVCFPDFSQIISEPSLVSTGKANASPTSSWGHRRTGAVSGAHFSLTYSTGISALLFLHHIPIHSFGAVP